MRRRIALLGTIVALIAAAAIADRSGRRDRQDRAREGRRARQLRGRRQGQAATRAQHGGALAAAAARRSTLTFRSGSTTRSTTVRRPATARRARARPQPQFDAAIKNDKLRHYVTATGSDGYQALVAWGEFDPDFGNQDILLAVSQDGLSLADEGPRLVVPATTAAAATSAAWCGCGSTAGADRRRVRPHDSTKPRRAAVVLSSAPAPRASAVPRASAASSSSRCARRRARGGSAANTESPRRGPAPVEDQQLEHQQRAGVAHVD